LMDASTIRRWSLE